MDRGVLCLRWRDHRTTLTRMVSSLLRREVYSDATIACDGHFYPVHKFVLSMCSDFFEQMFQIVEQKNMMIVLTDISHQDLEPLLDFVYLGEVNVLQSDLPRFMRAAERLKIKGLAEPSETSQRKDGGESKRSLPQWQDGTESKRRKKITDDTLALSKSEPQISPAKSIIGVREKEGDELVGRGSNEGSTVSHLEASQSANLVSVDMGESQDSAGVTAVSTVHHKSPSRKEDNSRCHYSQVKVEVTKEEAEDWCHTEGPECELSYEGEDGTQGLAPLGGHTTLPQPPPPPLHSVTATANWECTNPPAPGPSDTGHPQFSPQAASSQEEKEYGHLNKFGRKKRGRCSVCPRRDDRKTVIVCCLCANYVCRDHVVTKLGSLLCSKCACTQWFC